MDKSSCLTPPQSQADSLAAEPRVLSSQDLFRDSNTVEIEHRGQRYLLRLTRENKLILTK